MAPVCHACVRPVWESGTRLGGVTDKGRVPQGTPADGKPDAAPRPRRAFIESEPVETPPRPARGLVETTPESSPEPTGVRAPRAARALRAQNPEPVSGDERPSTDHDAYRRPEELSATARRRALVDDDTASPAAGLRSASRPQGTTVEQIDDRAPGRSRWPLFVAAPLVLALAAGGWWLSRDGFDAQPAPATSPSAQTPPASTTPSPNPTQGLTLQAPGKGTVASVKQRLLKEGFTCEAEGQPGMDSWVCTHYTKDPAMMAYIGGATGKRLGRVSLSVQDGPGGKAPEALGLQQWLAEQFIGDPASVKRVLAKTRTGTEEKYAEIVDGPINARGSSDGSLVLFVEGWVPNRAQPERLLPAKPLAAELEKLGYQCTDGAEAKCHRTATNFNYGLDYRVQDMQVTYLKLRTEATGQEPVVAAAAAEVQAVTSLFQQGPTIRAWLDKHRDDAAGATGFQDGLALDWYPGSSQKGGAASAFYLRESCWTDTVEPC